MFQSPADIRMFLTYSHQFLTDPAACKVRAPNIQKVRPRQASGSGFFGKISPHFPLEGTKRFEYEILNIYKISGQLCEYWLFRLMTFFLLGCTQKVGNPEGSAENCFHLITSAKREV